MKFDKVFQFPQIIVLRQHNVNKCCGRKISQLKFWLFYQQKVRRDNFDPLSLVNFHSSRALAPRWELSTLIYLSNIFTTWN